MLPKVIEHDELTTVIRQLENIETNIVSFHENEDRKQAELKLKSGRLLLKAKSLVRSKGLRWEIEVVNLIPKNKDGRPVLGKTSRSERMKVAKLPGVEKYTSLGWSKLVKIAGLVKPTGSDAVENLLHKCKVSLEQAESMSCGEFSLIVCVCIIKNDLKNNKINIPASLIEKAVKRGIKFDAKLIKTLGQSKKAEGTLRALIYFDTVGKNKESSTSPNAVTTQLEEMMEKTSKTLRLALETGAIPRHIPKYVYEDLAHYVGWMYYM